MRQLQLGQNFRNPSAPRLIASIGLREARLIVKSAEGPPGRLENEHGLENGALDSVGNFLPVSYEDAAGWVRTQGRECGGGEL